MKIAIPCNGDEISFHFGKCEKYLIFDDLNDKIIFLDNPGHEPFFLPKFLGEKNVKKIICNGIGSKAINLFNQLGIEVIMGVSGNVNQIIENYDNGTLKCGKSTCEHL